MFRRVPPEHRDQLARVSFLRTYERGRRVFDEGDPSDHFFIVVTGRVKVFRRTTRGSDVILEIFGPGGPLGAVALFESRPYPASAEAIESASCVLIPRQDFFTLLERHPALVRGLLGSLSLRLVELTRRLTELAGGRVEARLARLFLKLADQLGRPGHDGTQIPLLLSRQDLADLTGTTIETCIRVMSRWGRARILRTKKDGFVLVDRDALKTLADI